MSKSILNLLSEQSFEQKMDKAILALTAIANRKPITQEDTYKIGSWRTVQAIVRLGLANQFFHVGTQFQSEHTVYGTGEQHLLTWDVIGIDHDIPVDANGNYLTTIDADGATIPMHSLTIQLHDCIGTRYKWHRTAVNNWQNSDIRAWLNTDQTINDYSSNAGFLYEFDEDLLEVVGTVAKTTALNNSSGGKAIVLTEKFFLPSLAEVFGGDNNSYREGAIFLSKDTTVDLDKFYCTKDATTGIITKITTASITDDSNPSALGWYEVRGVYDYYGLERSELLNPGSGADVNRKKRIGTGNYDYWWLRSPITGYTNFTCGITSSGGTYDNFSNNTIGIAPACCII